jgi:hypothetical protein
VCLVSISIKAEALVEMITARVSQILLCDDEELQMLALAVYIKDTKPTLLIESEPFHMDFVINKDISLRSVLGNKKFTRLVDKTVDIIGNLNRINCILLLDKSK